MFVGLFLFLPFFFEFVAIFSCSDLEVASAVLALDYLIKTHRFVAMGAFDVHLRILLPLLVSGNSIHPQ